MCIIAWELAKQPSHKQIIWKAKQTGKRVAVYFNFTDEETIQSYRYCQNLNVDKIITNRVKLVKNFNENIEIKNNMKQQIMDNQSLGEEIMQKQFNFDIEEIKDDDEVQPKDFKARKRFLSNTEESSNKQGQFVENEIGEIVQCLLLQSKSKMKQLENDLDSTQQQSQDQIVQQQGQYDLLVEQDGNQLFDNYEGMVL